MTFEVPAAFRRYRQFIAYKLVPRDNGKSDKIPVDYRTGQNVDAHDSSAWTDADTVFAAGYPAAFVFTESDPFWFLDIDDAFDGEKWSDLSVRLLGMFPGAFVEVSASGRGLHVFGSGIVPDHGCKNTRLHLEFYTEKRFVALTGTHARGDADAWCDTGPLVAEFFPPAAESEHRGVVVIDAADDDLIARALRSRGAGSAFGDRATFRDLWEANETALARAFPSSKDDTYDRSSADAALAQHLAFWLGNDPERMARVMWRSALVRDKWDRDDYLPRTIERARSLQKEFYAPPAARVEVLPPEDGRDEATVLAASPVLFVSAQPDHFKGCVYIRSLHQILIPGGALLDQGQFRVQYGGHQFAMDPENQKMTQSAWECFTESRAVRFPKAELPCFKPEQPPGAIIEHEGQTMANLWWPVPIRRVKGDAGPFLDHLRRVLPNGRDADILLAYMAACVQHKGTKFQWAPLLQGTEGNGKTLFTRCVAYAVGKRYTHWPKASDLDNKFNGWLLNKLFVGVEDIFVAEHKQAVWETLKPMITGGDGLEIQLKGVDQVSADICANFMLNSNHKDGARKTRNDRRLAVFFTAQQSADDLFRDGMTGDYFPSLYDWLRADGYAIVAELLHTWKIPDDLNPATKCQRAPQTTSTEDAIAAGLGHVEQEVQEAIVQEVPGFAGGWISSLALDKLLERIGAARRVPINKRRELVQNLGYDLHPNLVAGRVNNVTVTDGGKPRLYVKPGSVQARIISPADIARTYDGAQSGFSKK